MKTHLLFPHQFRLVGIICMFCYVPAMVIKKILHHGYHNYNPAERLSDASGLFNSEHIFGAIGLALLIGGLFLIAFSKEKIEDEQILLVRLNSLQWATYLNYCLLILSAFFISDSHFRYIVLLDIWVPLVFFVIRFRWKIYQLNRMLVKDGDAI